LQPYTIGNYLAKAELKKIDANTPECKATVKEVEDKVNKLINVNGTKTPSYFHRKLGKLMWDKVGMARNDAGLKHALEEIPKIREEFWKDVKITGTGAEYNISLEKASRVADFLEFAEVMAYDALDRDESAGAHFREEHQTPDGEAKRNDDDYRYVAAWEYKGVGQRPELHKEELEFENVKLAVRSYK
jgi:succinate dehydrogenase / fumarate reductase flavoprotein subunit